MQAIRWNVMLHGGEDCVVGVIVHSRDDEVAQDGHAEPWRYERHKHFEVEEATAREGALCDIGCETHLRVAANTKAAMPMRMLPRPRAKMVQQSVRGALKCAEN